MNSTSRSGVRKRQAVLVPAAAGDSGQGRLGAEVGVDGVLDVHHVHPVAAGTDDAEAAGAGAGWNSGSATCAATTRRRPRP